MNAVQLTAVFAYNVGEEVVARLDHAEIFDVARGVEITAGPRPRWTIGSVVDCIYLRDGRGYVLSARYHDEPYVCLVPEDGIEGVA